MAILNCGTNSDPAACRAELSKAYQEKQKMLLKVLAAMNVRMEFSSSRVEAQDGYAGGFGGHGGRQG
jgi:hypothetical protein